MPTREISLVSLQERASASAWVGWLPLACVPFGALVIRNVLPPWLFMWTLAIALYASLKWVSWWRSPLRSRATKGRSIGYLIAWPGMDSESFLDDSLCVAPPAVRDWVWVCSKTALGAVLLWAVARRVPADAPLVRGWIGLVGCVLLAHFGSFHIVALMWQAVGVAAVPIMASPIASPSLSEFWGRRWNLGFRQLAHDFIFRPLHRALGVGGASFLVFVISGVVHDFVISLPARGGYGLPSAYFVLQSIGVSIERSRFGKRTGLRQGIRGWLFMAAFTAGPAFWLFHPPFVRNVVLPFMHVIHAI